MMPSLAPCRHVKVLIATITVFIALTCATLTTSFTTTTYSKNTRAFRRSKASSLPPPPIVESTFVLKASLKTSFVKKQPSSIDTLNAVASESTKTASKTPISKITTKYDLKKVSLAASLRRARDIFWIVTINMVIPLTRSLLTFTSTSIDHKVNNRNSTNINPPPDFWLHHYQNPKNLTNAEFVVQTLEKLGPTFVKFGQALASRPDIIPPSLANALLSLQDDMRPFSNAIAKRVIKRELEKKKQELVQEQQQQQQFNGNKNNSNKNNSTISVSIFNNNKVDKQRNNQQLFTNTDSLKTFLDSLSIEAVAAASIGQVYKGDLPAFGSVAIKVQRPGVHKIVRQDAVLLRSVAAFLEALPGLPGKQTSSLFAAKLVAAVDEFMLRLFEELDYRHEAANMALFYDLYSIQAGNATTFSGSTSIRVVVPQVLLNYCTERILVMSWIDGKKLSAVQGESPEELAQKLQLVKQGIACTLSQLLDTGIMHADPHAGNLLQVPDGRGGVRLGYLDFGILSTIPESVRDGLVCAVTQLVFSRDIKAVANLMGELQLVPQEVLDDPNERQALASALRKTFRDVVSYSPEVVRPSNKYRRGGRRTSIPKLRFDQLLGSLSLLLTRFQFSVPPYFLNNARALGTLEGIAKGLDPNFNVLQVVYPFAINRLLMNPSHSKVVDQTVQRLVQSPVTGWIDRRKMQKLIGDCAILSGRSRRQVMRDIARTIGGRRILKQYFRQKFSWQQRVDNQRVYKYRNVLDTDRRLLLKGPKQRLFRL